MSAQCTASCRMYSCFFFNDTATTEIYTLSLHDALPILAELETGDPFIVYTSRPEHRDALPRDLGESFQIRTLPETFSVREDRKSTRLNSSHANISYAVFCLKKKNTIISGIAVNPLLPMV